ncbi:dynactin P62 subunit [Culex quinquefasciatus]|uniref:Dynactin P62 subunit n=1 Tax=Culex quinquefasciatus TaxID=7176 RepID=B0XBW7_CULQU|nr:dynactin P62 subunit [Culex quinquefasciatus]|eukprot:XP_001867139.1 dynactin P62 subunit [Culex quinquefasciatus]
MTKSKYNPSSIKYCTLNQKVINQSNHQRHDHHDTGTANRRGETSYDRRGSNLSVAELISSTSSLASKQAGLLEDPRMVQNANGTFRLHFFNQN